MLVDFGIAQEDENGVQRVDLDDLCMHSPDPGVNNNFQEHDSSLVRKDFFLDQKNHCNVDAGLLRDGMCRNHCPFALFGFILLFVVKQLAALYQTCLPAQINSAYIYMYVPYDTCTCIIKI